MDINPQILTGHWKAGFALDLHTLSSVPKEWTTKKVTVTEFIDGKLVTVEKEVQDQITKWDTTYTPIGLEMNHLKYWKERHRAEIIGIVAAEWLQKQLPTWKINVVIPIPPSDITREFQPVYEIVRHIGSCCNLPIDFNILNKIKTTTPQKGIVDVVQRKEELKDAFAINDNSLLDKNVLLFDDLYRSGETLNTVCDILANKGKAASVYVLTITKTRRNR